MSQVEVSFPYKKHRAIARDPLYECVDNLNDDVIKQ